MANPTGRVARDKSVLYEQLVDTLNAVFGMHPGYRAVHAKGMVCEGVFQPAASAASVTRAAHLNGGAIPATVRFSNFSGIPTVPDCDPTASPRGMSIRFHLAGGQSTDLIAHSVNGFPVRTAEEFLAFLHALATSGPSLETFLDSHPQARQFVEAPKPTPRSYATERYYGVDTFRFTNREGVSRHGRYRIVPSAGPQYLHPAEAATRPADFLFDELGERLSRQAVEFRLVAQLASEEDAVDDPSTAWPDRRPLVELGSLSITRRIGDSEAAERALGFDPARLVEGIEPGDALIEARSAIYAIAGRRRGSQRT